MGKLIEQLGIADAMKGKIIHRPALEGGVQLVASGEAEIGFYPKSEVINTDGLTVVGPLPAAHSAYDDLRRGRHGSEPGAGRRRKAFIKFMTDPDAPRPHGPTQASIRRA